ncbi:type VI secretion system Vgr family protein [Paraburkholderia sp. J7]|uniref:type VI secretion system Vgr family protein n=1 Tax=Paraburkholderia sp. J7 TaxID=2805438 RepID=UPI002AB62D07|nr:type VI secretion system tip protein TssI/VgrG [Paraburkholderia sp. J7]
MGVSPFKPLQARTLSIRCDAIPTWGRDEVLAPVRLHGTEALGKLYRYELDLMTVDSPTLRVYQAREMIQPEELIDAVIDITVAFEGNGTFVPGMPGNTGAGNVGAGTRTITGLITSVQITGSDDRHMYYRFIVRPSLWLAKKTVENRIFQNMNVVEISEEVLGDHDVVVELRLGAPGFDSTYPPRDYVRQFWCSDFDFLTMLWREWGLYYFYEGSTLVLCDSPGSHHEHSNMYDKMRYHAPGSERIDEEHIHRLEVSRTITTGQVDVVDYDYTEPRAMFTGESYNNSGPSEQARHYWWGDYSQPLAGAQGLSSTPNDYQNEADNLASVRLDAMRCRRQRLKGTGNLRGLTTGKTFWLVDHPEKSVNAEYLVVSTTIDIRNNGLETQRTGNVAAYHCVTDFVLQPANTFFKNKPKKKPRAHAETAVVTGYDDRKVWPDAYARVKVHFVWDRRNEPDLNASCWLRVSSPWQGSGYGFIAIPRVGDEVTVSYHEGDPDKPFVSGRQVNQFNLPPWKLPDNLALTGLRSRNLEGQDSNHVLTDDTPGKLQVQVASDHAQSRLVLGYNTRIDGRNGRDTARGEGFELATEAAGVLRANRGMLVTTEARAGASAHAKDLAETVGRLDTAHTIHQALAQSAQESEAQDATGHQADIATTIQTQNDQIRGASGNPFPQLSEPHLVMDGKAGVEIVSPATVHIAAQQTAVTTEGHVAIASGRSLFASVRDTIRLYAQRSHIKLSAAMGDIMLHALNSAISLESAKSIKLLSKVVQITGVERLELQGGKSRLVLDDAGAQIFTPGKFAAFASSHALPGPRSTPADLSPRKICIDCLLKAAKSGSAFVIR